MRLKLLLSCLLCFAIVSPVAADVAKQASFELKTKHKKKKKKTKYAPQQIPAPAPNPNNYFKFRDSALAHQILDGKRGLEIGASAHNPFNLKTLNLDFSDDYTQEFKAYEAQICGEYARVDIVSPGDELPFKDNTWDFVINSHVIEHFYDPVKTIKEWLRVVKPGGYVFMIVPHKERTFDKPRPRTPLAEIVDRHEHPNPPFPDLHGHYSVWITEDFLEICNYYGWQVVAFQDVDDKVGNGFTVVIQKAAETIDR